MTRLLILDDNRTPAELVGREITERLRYEVVVLDNVADCTAELVRTAGFDVALVDLAFRHSKQSGLDALVTFTHHSSTTRLIVYTQGDDWVADTLRLAWEAIPLATAVSKSMPLNALVATIERVVRDGTAPVDPVLAPFLPPTRSPARRADQFARLVTHLGHAKLWRALVRSSPEASYGELMQLSGLKVNTIKNYREQLLPELEAHGLSKPPMRDLREFAIRCYPLLAPYVAGRLDSEN